MISRATSSVLVALTALAIVVLLPTVAVAGDGFTQRDRDMLIRLDATLKAFMREVDKRFEQVDKRFEQVDKRFEQVDKRFEQVDKRFEQVNERIGDLMGFLWILAGIFATIMAANIGFAYWDRRTIIRTARHETVEFMEREGKLAAVINAFRELARDNPQIAEALKKYNLL